MEETKTAKTKATQDNKPEKKGDKNPNQIS
jgi:hypothetical protein